ncbi:DinB family protein [Parafilimonas sp.]|uniref:DinB family protein n=1 Tax=Parafilimonas sp. TaxID=1969739 RepID=UPI0039E6ED64
MARPQADESAPFYHKYIALAAGNSVSEIVNTYAFDVQEFYNSLPENKADYAYADGKWTVKEVLQHLTDAERIFAYRALRISRGDKTPLHSFEENDYVENGFAEERSLSSLKQEFNSVRAATDIFLLGLNKEQISRTGTASNNTISVNALAYIIYGHLLHHRNILRERYGI